MRPPRRRGQPEEAQRQAQELAAEAAEQASEAEAQVKAAEQIREQSTATAKRTARELQRNPSNGNLKSYNKPELVELAASIGIEGRTTMSKNELVDAIREGVAQQALNRRRARMGLFNRKSQFERLLDAVDDSLDVPSEIKGLRKGGSGKAMKAGLITTAGLAGLTAGSAGISALRRRGGSSSGS